MSVSRSMEGSSLPINDERKSRPSSGVHNDSRSKGHYSVEWYCSLPVALRAFPPAKSFGPIFLSPSLSTLSLEDSGATRGGNAEEERGLGADGLSLFNSSRGRGSVHNARSGDP